MDEEEIPIGNPLADDPFIDEASAGEVEEVGEVTEELSEDIGGYNEVPIFDDLILPSFELGNTYILLLESRANPFMGKIVEILVKDGILKMEDEENRILTFIFESGEILRRTDDYEILDMIRVIPYLPEEEDESGYEDDYEFDLD